MIFRRNFLRFVGPGIITAALIFGPGSLIINSKLGSLYQYQLLWIILLATFFMIVFTIMSAKFGLASRESMMQTIRQRYGKIFSLFIGICITVVTISFQTGNAIGSGLSIGGLMGHNPALWILFFSIFAIMLLFFKSFYRILERLMILMVILMIVSFMVTLLISRPDPGKILTGFLPVIPTGSVFLTIALVASSFSLVGAFFQSYLVQQKNWRPEDKRICILEGISGIIILGFISMLVLTTAGSVLFNRGIEVRSAADLGLVLEPLFGSFAFGIFMTGMFAASFSSLIGNATLGGTILADLLRLPTDLRTLPVRILIMMIIALGATVAILFRQFGIELIIMAQAFTVLLAPFVGLMIFLLTDNRTIMGNLRNGRMLRIIGITGLGLLFLLAVVYATGLIGSNMV
jgi:manganese transport protein